MYRLATGIVADTATRLGSAQSLGRVHTAPASRESRETRDTRLGSVGKTCRTSQSWIEGGEMGQKRKTSERRLVRHEGLYSRDQRVMEGRVSLTTTRCKQGTGGEEPTLPGRGALGAGDEMIPCARRRYQEELEGDARTAGMPVESTSLATCIVSMVMTSDSSACDGGLSDACHWRGWPSCEMTYPLLRYR